MITQIRTKEPPGILREFHGFTSVTEALEDPQVNDYLLTNNLQVVDSHEWPDDDEHAIMVELSRT